MKTNMQHIARIVALSLVLMVSLTVGASVLVHRSTCVSKNAARIDSWRNSQVLLVCGGGDGGQESHGGGKGGGGGGGGHSHG
jgi:uncharacterized membrane protein YgcG